MATLQDGVFADYDDTDVCSSSTRKAELGQTKNFVVDFGEQKAQIAFDLNADHLKHVLTSARPDRQPVRWINIWGPDKQKEAVKLLSEKYGFSPRLRGIILTKPKPPTDTSSRQDKPHATFWLRPQSKDDVESATKSLEQPSLEQPSLDMDAPSSQFDHYNVASSMINYHAIDYGDHFTCIGANWLHKEQHGQCEMSADSKMQDEGTQRRLYSWLILCKDNTVISLQEDPSFITNDEDLKETRSNLLSVLRQLSKVKHDSIDPLSWQSVRQALDGLDGEKVGIEGASNLFYYLFDDWLAVYHTVGFFRKRLKSLQDVIIDSSSQKSYEMPDIAIIPRLHILGQEIRTMHHVYEGYKNLISRILEPPKSAILEDLTPSRSRSFSMMSAPACLSPLPPENNTRNLVSRSAAARFERLGDRLQLLILSQTNEFLVEKEALMNTYFSINAQKDSKATARLSRAATLLAKLSVVFLPVSLMTSYFSVQIADLQGVYTSKQYWYAFAVIMSISVLALFFFSRLLMWATETLDSVVKKGDRKSVV